MLGGVTLRRWSPTKLKIGLVHRNFSEGVGVSKPVSLTMYFYKSGFKNTWLMKNCLVKSKEMKKSFSIF